MNKNIEWEQQLIKYVVEKTSHELADIEKPSIPMKFQLLNKALSDIALIGVLKQEMWTFESKPIELLRIYNPDSLTWERMDFVLMGLLSGILGVYQDSDVAKLSAFLFNIYRKSDYLRVPDEYSGSRYVLFDNGVFDSKDKKLIPIPRNIKSLEPYEHGKPIDVILIDDTVQLEIYGENIVLPFIGFSEKHKHHFKLDLEAPNKAYKSNSINVDWTPKEWLLKTVGGNKEEAKFLLQVLGVMLVPNHSFNAFVEINGASSSGKTTLVNIVNSIYGGNKGVMLGYTLDDLNDTFPFRGNINRETVLVHITETNGSGLKSSGISLINSFANQSMQMKQMGSTSIMLTPPPILVLEGKGWVLFDSTKTGIARRLLPIDITSSTTFNYRNLRYGKRIFLRPKVLAWFAKEIMLAYADLTKGDDDYMFNIDNVESLPEFARRWHLDAINAGDDLMNRFIERIEPTLKTGYISTQLLYELYIESVKLDNPDEKYMRHSKSFKEAVKVYLSKDFKLTKIDALMCFERKDLGINIESVEESIPVPYGLKNYKNSKYARYRQLDWYRIEKKGE